MIAAAGTGGTKHDTGKSRVDLIPPGPMLQIGEVLEHGISLLGICGPVPHAAVMTQAAMKIVRWYLLHYSSYAIKKPLVFMAKKDPPLLIK